MRVRIHRMRRTLILSLFLFLGLATSERAAIAQPPTYTILPGDTWVALAMRFNVEENELHRLNPHFNTSRQPTIGTSITLPDNAAERSGRMVRPGSESTLSTAVRFQLSPWAIAALNRLESPYRPNLYRPLFIPGDGTIRDFPPGIDSLELSVTSPDPGQALGIRGTTIDENATIIARMDGLPVSIAGTSNRFVGVVGTGAFYAGGEPELIIQVDDHPAWSQPWGFAEREWDYQELTLTGEAAEIDQQSRDEERARLRELWTHITPNPQWTDRFSTPINDFLSVTANYGARRSYNGGPYLTYHEGIDFSAYAGTPVFAPAAGTVVLAERLYVRGGAVILDHGLGIYSGYYHLSAVHVTSGQTVQPGTILGEVGMTGLSTGNHLHWDVLVNGIWVDPAAWQEQGIDCWLLEGLGSPCSPPAPTE